MVVICASSSSALLPKWCRVGGGQRVVCTSFSLSFACHLHTVQQAHKSVRSRQSTAD